MRKHLDHAENEADFMDYDTAMKCLRALEDAAARTPLRRRRRNADKRRLRKVQSGSPDGVAGAKPPQ